MVSVAVPGEPSVPPPTAFWSFSVSDRDVTAPGFARMGTSKVFCVSPGPKVRAAGLGAP